MIDLENYDFGGRLKPKSEGSPGWEDLVSLANDKQAFVYQRLSSHEQTKKSRWSMELQDSLIEQARRDGYPLSLIHIERRDLGLSGTLGREDRPGLACLIRQVEACQVEAVYVVEIGRLYRDQTLIHAFSLGELFKEYGVIVVTPWRRFNLRDKLHMQYYRREAERAAEELEVMGNRLLSARALKAKTGGYCGEGLPAGIILDPREEINGLPNPTFRQFVAYEPHAEIVRLFFERLYAGMNGREIARWCHANDVVFPFFAPEVDTGANRKSFANTVRLPGGWLITAAKVVRTATNPGLIGWKIWGGEVVSMDAYPAIVGEDLFWEVQRILAGNPRPQPQPKKDFDPLPLAGLLYCGEHDDLRRMNYSNRETTRKSLYHCVDPAIRVECVCVSAYILDGPIGEAVVSQVSVPELAEEVLTKLTDEYQRAKEQAASYRREARRLEAEVENLRGNLVNSILGPDQLDWIEQQIQQRMGRIRELAELESQPIGQAVGRSAPGQADIDLVRGFLTNLPDRWENMPNGLKNTFLHLLLDRIVIWHADPLVIHVRLLWRVGREQSMRIHRPYSSYKKQQRRRWTEEEVTILRTHYATAHKERLLEMLPDREWLAITYKAKALGLPSRPAHLGRPSRVTPPFTPEEDELVRQYYAGEISPMEVMTSTGRRMVSIRRRAKKLGVKLQKRVLWEWVDGEEGDGDGTIMSEPGSPSKLPAEARDSR